MGLKSISQTIAVKIKLHVIIGNRNLAYIIKLFSFGSGKSEKRKICHSFVEYPWKYLLPEFLKSRGRKNTNRAKVYVQPNFKLQLQCMSIYLTLFATSVCREVIACIVCYWETTSDSPVITNKIIFTLLAQIYN